MKKCLKIFFLVLAVTSFVIGCSEEEDTNNQNEILEAVELNLFDKEYIKDAPSAERIQYSNHHLLHLAKTINKTNPRFVEEFQAKINKGGSDEISFQELFDNSSLKGNLDEATKFALDAFNGVSDDNLVPSVRLIKEGATENPIILLVTYDLNQNKKFCHGYEFDDDGELVMFSSDVREEDILGLDSSKASRTTLYVEAGTDCDGNYYKSGSCGGSGGVGGTSTSRSLKIASFNVSEKKETWPARPEIRFKGYIVANANTSCGDARVVTGSLSCGNASGKQIARIKRSQVGDNVSVNFTVDRNGSSYSPGNEYLAFVMYEYDGFPAPEVGAFPFGFNPDGFKIDIRSWESSYAKGTLVERDLYPTSTSSVVNARSTTFFGNHGKFTFVGR